MASIRRSNRASKRKIYWEPSIDPPRKRQPPRRQQPPPFTIHADPPEDLSTQLHEGLTEGLIEGLSPQLSDEDLSDTLSPQLSDEDLSDTLSPRLSDEDLSDALSPQLYDEDLSDYLSQLSDEDLSQALSTQLFDKDLSDALSAQLYEGLGVDPSYQPQFLPEDRAGKPQNLPEDSNSVKLFQLFFTVKEIKNIVKQINQQAVCINFKYLWKFLTVTEIYCYLECLVYIGVQSLQELDDH